MIVHQSSQRWHRNSVVVLIALIAVLAMHGLTSDHGTGMPGMRMTAGPVMAVEMKNSVGVMAGSAVAAADTRLHHAGGMCVGILGIGLLLRLIARSRRAGRLRVASSAPGVLARTVQARAGPLPPLSRPSLVTLGISRT